MAAAPKIQSAAEKVSTEHFEQMLGTFGFRDRYQGAFAGLGTPIAGLTDLLLVRSGGKFETHAGDAAEVQAVTDLATELKGVAGSPVAGEELVVIEAELRLLLASGRSKLKACLDEIAGGSAAATVACVFAHLVQDVLQQRRGYPFEEEKMPGELLVGKFAHALSQPKTTRHLGGVDVMKVMSQGAEKASAARKQIFGEMSISFEGSEGRKAPALKVSASVVRMQIILVFNGLTLACARSVLEEGRGGPRAGPTGTKHGVLSMGGQSLRRDAHFMEVERARDRLLHRLDGMTGAEILGRFDQYWTLLRDLVSGSGENMTVAFALATLGREMRVQALGESSQAKPTSRKETEREPHSPTKKAKKPRTDGPPTPGKKGPNTSGALCKKYVADGECKFGDTCIHRHPRDRSDAKVAGDARD